MTNLKVSDLKRDAPGNAIMQFSDESPGVFIDSAHAAWYSAWLTNMLLRDKLFGDDKIQMERLCGILAGPMRQQESAKGK